jgi:hypothetical protein
MDGDMRFILALFLMQTSIVNEVAESGRVVVLAENPSDRIIPHSQIAPGQPPLLSFRYFEGKQRQRFGDLDLVLDDAGH